MQKKTVSDLIREYFAAYERKDRPALEKLLRDDFTFSSPLDDEISRSSYFERCWPNSRNHRAFKIDKCFEAGNEAFVTYECERNDGVRFRNTEFFITDGERIRHVNVYFGRSTAAASATDEIRKLVEQTAEACRAKDAAALVAHYAPDVIAFDLITPLHYKGSEAVGKRAAEWFASFRGPIEYEIRDLRMTAADEAAFCHSLNHVSGTKTDGASVQMRWRATLCLRKLEDKWLITHAHNSVPFDMETGKASLGL